MPQDPSHTQSLSEAEEKMLLQRLASGDKDAFNRLYRHYQPMLYKFAVLFSNSRFLAEETVQNVLFRLWSRRETFIGVQSLEKFLITMAKNELLNQYKKTATERKHIHGNITEYYSPVEDAFDYKAYQQVFKEAVGQLPEKQKEIFLLRNTQDLSMEEIASLTGSNREAVKRNFSRAVESIKEYLRRHGDWTGVLFWLFAEK